MQRFACRRALALAGLQSRIASATRLSQPPPLLFNTRMMSGSSGGAVGGTGKTGGNDDEQPCQLPQELQDTIKSIIGQSRIVVFLTGTPDAPRCRFTSALVDILRQVGVHYSYYNILDDDEVCEGLKEYSSWPTYPQVYIDGELIGGYDVTKQMLLSGELTKLLKAKELL